MGPNELLTELGITGKILPIAGGDINQSYRVVTGAGDYFLKYHPGVKKNFFQAEIHGLQELAAHVTVPQVERSGDLSQGAYLLMEWIEPGFGSQAELAAALAGLHRQTAASFGFYEDNYIGILPQVNAQTQDWTTFYLTCRLDVQVELAKLHNVWTPKREEQYLRLKEFIADQWQGRQVLPSLLHGDFWSGNTFFDQKGRPIFVDPAVAYGDREMDIAMALLFGGSRRELIDTYNDLFPLEAGWQERSAIYQLYYLLVHLNQFGESYGGQVDEILDRF